MIYILLISLILIFFAVIFIDKDFLSPAAIICESYVLAVICAIYNIDLWNINLSTKTVKIIIIGVLSFVIPSCILLHTFIKNKGNENIDKLKKDSPFYIRKKMYIFFLILQFVTVFLYLYFVIKTVGGIKNIFNLSDIMNEYREGTSYGDLESLIPSYVNQLVKISQIISYISMYNILYRRMIEKKCNDLLWLNIISISLYIILTLLSGGRYKMISFLLGSLMMWNFINKKNNRKKLALGNLFKIAVIVFIILIIFSQTRTLVGRTNNQDFLTYITSYFGGSIQLFDMFLKNPVQSSSIFGKESFYAINSFLSKFGFVESYRMHLEFRTSNGIVIGNVYTAFRCFYYDFGLSGVIILQILLAYIWTKWYKIIKKSKYLFRFDSKMIFFCMFVNCLFFNSYRDNFFSTVISVSTLTMIFYFLVIKKLLIIDKNNKEGE